MSDRELVEELARALTESRRKTTVVGTPPESALAANDKITARDLLPIVASERLDEHLQLCIICFDEEDAPCCERGRELARAAKGE